MHNNKLKKIVNILLFGVTGNGKSTVGNVLMNENEYFKTSAYGSSQTKGFQVGKITLNTTGDYYKNNNDNSNNNNYSNRCNLYFDSELEISVIDTCGVNDTDLTIKEVLYQLSRACNQLLGGLHQVFFVVKGRFTEEERLAFDVLTNTLFCEGNIKPHITIVRTGFHNFRDKVECQTDIDSLFDVRMKNQKNPSGQPQLGIGRDKIIHVNIDSKIGDAWNDSRQKLLEYIRTNCSNDTPYIIDDDLKGLGERIVSYQSEIEQFEQTLADVTEEKKKLKSASCQDDIQQRLKQIETTMAETTNKLLSFENEIAQEAQRQKNSNTGRGRRTVLDRLSYVHEGVDTGEKIIKGVVGIATLASKCCIQ